ncbi:LolA family protein [Rickettsia endosymbiont of Cardiosporidium cionae]|uniref:LolA family protein n=1 Tax=Rickettsia endosymbiont of Cardiosporidium cionae TaxID=2777155 RepID=UPI001893D2E0|nr:outer-membrane lipoprotein carrier protein LolA [Rickettsia endosymbiont of Cardiosporidium cionae]KAF8818677.1 outer membrane lipoprotein carrier protein LolA [Rickettsia endosymbiont of Cardiosporidium cionae]
MRIFVRSFVFLILSIFLTISNNACFSDIHQETDSRYKNSHTMLAEYIDAMQSCVMDFVHYDSTSKDKYYGSLLINKNYNFRFNYYQPYPLLIVGDKDYISIYDYDMKHLSRIKTVEYINLLLLCDKDYLNQKIKIIYEAIVDDKYIVKAIHNNSSDYVLSLQFNSVNKKLEKIEVTEFDNLVTIEINDVIKLQYISDSLFVIRDPEVFAVPERLNKSQLSKLYRE